MVTSSLSDPQETAIKENSDPNVLQNSSTIELESLPAEESCIFCDKKSKRVGSKRQFCRPLSDEMKEKIIKYNDKTILEKIHSSHLLFYHPLCYTNYSKKIIMKNEKQTNITDWHKRRELHKTAFELLSTFIKTDIIEKQQIFLLDELYAEYQSILYELNNCTEDSFVNFTSQHLHEKLSCNFGDCVVVTYSESLHKHIVYRKDIDVKVLVNHILQKIEQKSQIRKAAYEIRKSIMALETKKNPEELTCEHILEGECDIPEELLHFITFLIKGPNKQRSENNEDEIRIRSICEDIIYSTHKGRIKPRKHMKLGLTVKTLTNSRKLLLLLNRLGHSIAYTTAEELETEITYTEFKKNKVIPSGININKTSCTHVAFDNYDRFVETLDGKDTLHDTVGIIYQFKNESENLEVPNITHDSEETEIPTTSTNVRTIRRRRRFDEIPLEVTPYYKKPKVITTLTSLENININTASKENAVVRDLIWMFCLSLMPDITPMWTGFNSQTNIEESSVQIVDYLPQINMSPTSYSVVNETMSLTENIRKQCDQDYIIVTYDLAIAKMAMQVQSEEAPKYDNLIVNLGGFHIQSAFYKALGKFLDCCGVENILIESGVIAAGSINGFISGKHFNRCKRVHTLLSGALQTLHFEMFLKKKILDVDNVRDELSLLLQKQSDPTVEQSLSPALKSIIEEYRKFAELTLHGDHGKTAKYYMMYIFFMNIYFRFSRSIRISDFSLMIETLYEMANLFFIFNHQNYSRWILKYLSNILIIAEQKPQILTDFKKGVFGVKRTNINMSRSPVDLTLEQTVNANAGNTLTGLTHMTNSIGARQRWALSHTIRSKIVTSMMEDAEIFSKEDVTSDLKKCQLEKDVNCLKDLIKAIKKCSNPFDENRASDELFNLSTGRATKEDTANFLLNAFEYGELQKLQFINECNNDPTRFEKTIKQNKIQNFAVEATSKIQKSGEKIIHLKMERDIFGRLLALSLKHQIDIDTCLSFPLAPLPPALSQYNGDMFQTPKSKLATALKNHITITENPENINEDVYLIDGFHLLRTMGTVPQMYGKISGHILQKICNTTAKEIHLIFDIYKTPSIKDPERCKRRTQNTPYQIFGETQSRDTNFF